jgi:hypothetical protein
MQMLTVAESSSSLFARLWISPLQVQCEPSALLEFFQIMSQGDCTDCTDDTDAGGMKLIYAIVFKTRMACAALEERPNL